MEDPSSSADADEARLPAGSRLGKYEIVRLIGQGGMGAVYEGIHTEMGKRVAIKTLSPSVSEIPGARQRFVREAQLTSKVRHPHIVDVSDVGTDGGRAFLVMELLSGEDLSQRLARTGAIGPRELADIMLPVCSALVAAHDATIVHRDLKPQNIFLATGPHGALPKVLDFGISKSTDALSAGALTRTGSVMGTPFYLAPEQIQDARSAGPSSDQYALGVILYECLSGQRPFEGESLFSVFNAIVNERPPALRSLRPDLPAGLDQIVDRAMSAKVGQRFPSVRALGRALLPFASPKAQVIWDDAFAAVAGDEPAPGPAVAAPFAPTPTPPPARATAPAPARTPTPPPAARTPAPMFASTTPYGASVAVREQTPAPRSRTPIVIGIVVVAIIGAVAAFALRSNPAPAPKVATPAPVLPAPKAPAPAAPEPKAAAPAPEPKVAAPAPAVVAPAPAPRPAPVEVREIASKPKRSSATRRHASPPAPAPAAPAAAPVPNRRSFNPNGAPVID